MKQALILGAASDMAQAVAHRFGAAGFNLILAARNVERLDTTARDLKIRHNIQVQTVEFDALDFASHAEFYRSLSPPPNVAIVVFGYLGDQEAGQQDFEEAARIINTNYTGAVSILNIIANDLEQRQQGAIIGVSSVAGDRGRQSNHLYGSAKAGLTAYLCSTKDR